MKNADLIQEIERIKSTLTQAQKHLEDDKLKEAAYHTFLALLDLKPIKATISNIFYEKPSRSNQ